MTEKDTDSLMRRVLLDAVSFDLDHAHSPDSEFHPTRHHTKEMHFMLKDPLRWVKRRTKSVEQKVLHRIAAVFIVILIGLGLAALLHSPAWAAIERWIIEWYTTHIVYRYTGEADSLPEYNLTSLPNEYDEVSREENVSSVNIMYQDQSGHMIFFEYSAISQGGATLIVSNDDTVYEVKIGDKDGKLFIPEDPHNMKTITWIDDKTSIQFIIIANISEANLINLAESVRIT